MFYVNLYTFIYIQISLAIEMNKPIMLHQKGAHEDFLCIIKNHMPLMMPTILHSFTGSYEEATDYINLGMYIGITGMYSIMTCYVIHKYKESILYSLILFSGGLCKDSSGSGIKKLLNAGILTLDRILVQSDSPFMYPNARAANLSEAIKSSLTQRYFTINDKKLFDYEKLKLQDKIIRQLDKNIFN